MTPETPRRPSRIPEYAEACLQALVAQGLGGAISLGGGLGLLHYFSFQVAHRSTQLEPSTRSPWAGVPLDSFADLVASKMVALVERGAPRDFRDIFAVCQADLVSARECWMLWRRRQTAAGSDVDPGRARLAVETHLARIAQHRRIEQIADPGERGEAERVRTWFAQEFLNAIS
jgi:hypothetical protein